MLTVNADRQRGVSLAACALFTARDARSPLIFIILIVGGFFRSLQFTADQHAWPMPGVEPAQMSRATALVSVNQQLAISAGVAVGAVSVGIDHGLSAPSPS